METLLNPCQTIGQGHQGFHYRIALTEIGTHSLNQTINQPINQASK
jgi:hypothetical protein